MKFLHFSTDDGRWGAGKAAHELHTALRTAGHVSRMMVRNRTGLDPDVIQVRVSPARYRLAKLKRLLGLSPRRTVVPVYFNFNFDDEELLSRSDLRGVPQEEVEILCVHWIDDLLTLRDIRALQMHYHAPVIWTMMDMEPITGGCHYTFGCSRYMDECGCCPQLRPCGVQDHSWRLLRRKRRLLADLPVLVRCGTNGSAAAARKSAALGMKQVFVNPGPIDERVFQPRDRRQARRELGLAEDREYVLFGARVLDDPRKGLELMVEALRRLRDLSTAKHSDLANITVLLLGEGTPDVLNRTVVECRRMGLISDARRLATVYQASSVFLNCSVEDEGPAMMAQAMMCGTPPISFPTRLAVDLVQTGRTGFLCPHSNAEELAAGIQFFFATDNQVAMGRAVGEIARKTFSETSVIQSLVDTCNAAITQYNETGGMGWRRWNGDKASRRAGVARHAERTKGCYT